jgi:hypothetical protein
LTDKVVHLVQKKILDTIQDIFILSSAGLPYFSMCFGGELCKRKPDHLLQSGFIAALFQFSMEFGQKSIRDIIFEEGQMIFAKTKIATDEIIAVFFSSNEASPIEIRKVAEAACEVFKSTYESKISNSNKIINILEFTGFSEVLLKLNLINRKASGPVQLMKKKSFLERLKDIQ